MRRFVEGRMNYYAECNEQGPFSLFNARPNTLKIRAEKLIGLGTNAYREGVVCLRPFNLKIETHEFLRLYPPQEVRRDHFVDYTTAIHQRIPKGDAFYVSLISPSWSLIRELALSVCISTFRILLMWFIPLSQ